jgi:hypothetical protein
MLAATPLVTTLGLVAAFALVAIIGQIIARVASPEASENFVADAATLFGMAVLLALLAILIYAMIAITRRLLARKRA